MVSGSDPELGAFAAIQRRWTAGICTALTTSIRHYYGGGGGGGGGGGSIEFVTEVSAKGVGGTATA
eukprot:SAG22_NODE_15288_length_352_cov_0.920949_1_plen_65_part_10